MESILGAILGAIILFIAILLIGFIHDILERYGDLLIFGILCIFSLLIIYIGYLINDIVVGGILIILGFSSFIFFGWCFLIAFKNKKIH